MSRIRTTAAALSAAALIGTGGMTAAQAATSSSSSSPARPAHRHGGPLSSAQLGAIATQLGVTTAQLKAAMQAGRPDKPGGSAGPGGPGGPDGMATDLAKALGADVAKVEAILDANRPARPPRGRTPATRPAKPDNAKLVAALASGLNIDEATVKAAFAKLDAAHKDDRGDRQAAMYAAVAKQLGVSADAVQAAFEANRPARPAA